MRDYSDAPQTRFSGASGSSPPLLGMMDRGRQFLSHGIAQGSLALVDQAVVSGTRFLTTVVVGRACGADALGTYSLAFVFVIAFACVQEALVSTPYVVFSRRLRGQDLCRFSGSVLVHSAMLSILSACVLFGLGAAFSFHSDLKPLAWLLCILGVVMPFCLCREFARKFVFAQLQLVTALGIDVVASVFQVGGLFALAYYDVLSPATALAVTGLGCAVSGLGWIYLARARFRPRLADALQDLPQNWRFGRWLCATQMTGVLHGSLVEWIIMFMLGMAATGRYAACLALVMMANPFILGIVNYMTPKAVIALAVEGHPGVRRVTWTTSFLFAGVVGMYALILTTFGDRLLVVIFGEEFSGQTLITALSLCSLAWGQSAALSCGLAAIERTDVSFRAGLTGLVTTMISVPAMTALWGTTGAAIGLLSGSTTAAAIRTFAFARLTRESNQHDHAFEGG